jgi:hypothetical protein
LIRVSRYFDPTARICRQDRTSSNRFDTGITFSASGKAEEIVRKQQVHDLATAIRPDHATARRARKHEVAIVCRLSLTADFLSSLETQNGGKMVDLPQKMRYV